MSLVDLLIFIFNIQTDSIQDGDPVYKVWEEVSVFPISPQAFQI